ncbi:SlyX family protein [Undibacterium sp. RuTC16W]|uniref:SlyX family protein n=1 Tax=Undibacterium sp. RuTC16W TaxID=3413048 RepID=UPI003BF0C7E5
MDVKAIDHRLEELEIKISRQEDVVDTLNQLVYEQQKKIAELEALCTALVGRMKEMAINASQQRIIDERPPHY